jgi:CMP-N-acetylneuraminic acid synthetase
MNKKIEVLGLITARGGSKRLPGKNIKRLCKKPLIAWTAEAARKSRFINRVILSTDDKQIAAVAKKWGVEVPFMRPSSLAKDSTPHMAVLEHVIFWLRKNEKRLPEYILVLQPTSPLRISGDIDSAIKIAIRERADAVIGVCELTKNPTMVWQLTAEGTLRSADYYRSQKTGRYFVPNGAIYLIRTSVLIAKQTLYPEKTFPYLMPAARSLDIDTPWDFYMAELILNEHYEYRSKR